MNLGVDVGGTWLRACLADGARVYRRGRVPSPRPFRPERALRALLADWGRPKIDLLTLGSTGVWTPAERRALEKRLSPLARRVRALSDAELAHRAAFAGGPGVLLIAGTGSIALARGKGAMRRAGGLGPLLGDEGSGFWLGKRALAVMPERFARGLALRLAHSQETVRETAALARRVLALAARGDAKARTLRAEAAAALADIAEQAARGAGLRRAAVCAHGSLFSDSGLRAEVSRALRARGLGALVEPQLAADVAAAVL